MRTSKYILTANDYGAISCIDQGIIKAIRAGKINSVACFVTRFERNGKMELPKRIYFHLADAEYRVQQGLNEEQSVHIKTYEGIDSGYFK